MAFLPIAAAGLGALGSIFGANSAASAQNNATNAAAQATAGQQALTQQQLAIYQSLLGQYNQNVQPLQNPLSSQYAGLLAGDNSSAIAGADINALENPDAATGIDVKGLTNNALQYLSNPNATQAQQVGASVVPSLLAGGAGDTNLGSLTPGAIQSLLSGGVTGTGNSPGVGADALNYYLSQAQNGGIDPTLQNNALRQQQTGFDTNLADLRNSLGGRTNINALVSQQGTQQEQSRANLIAQLTGQSQQLRTGAMGSALAAAQGIDQQTNANTQTALGDAGNLDQQSLQYMLAALQSAGGLDAQTLQMLTGAQKLGSDQEQTQIGNLNQAQSTNAALLQQIQQYIAQGQAGATGVASGVGGVASTYGNAATAAAGNAASAGAATNPFSGLGTILSGYNAATAKNNPNSGAVGGTTYTNTQPYAQVTGDPTGLGWG